MISEETFKDIKDIKDKVNIIFDIAQENQCDIKELQATVKAKKFWDRTVNLIGGTIGGAAAFISFHLFGIGK